jgi:hypothetical protein
MELSGSTKSTHEGEGLLTGTLVDRTEIKKPFGVSKGMTISGQYNPFTGELQSLPEGPPLCRKRLG